jgi:hypothetical protein
MAFVLCLSGSLIAALILLRHCLRAEDRIVISAIIDRPVSPVFKIVADGRSHPLWHRQPRWLPEWLRSFRLARLGHHIPETLRKSRQHGGITEDIRIRCITNHEYSYRCTRPQQLTYESIFYFRPERGKCLLIWEFRYRLQRLPDILCAGAISSAARESMASSMDYISHLASCGPDGIPAQRGIFAAGRGQVPAA